MSTFKTRAYGATGNLIVGKSLQPMEVERQSPQAGEVLIEVLYCGVCHSDLHQVENDWANTIYPCVPGHEIIGRVVTAGAGVADLSPGDVVGVGAMINSCQSCLSCQRGEEQYCESPTGPTMTYNGYLFADGSGFNTFGGYSTHVVVPEKFVLRIPPNLKLSVAAPILCAGVTTYSPLKRAGLAPGARVGVIGLGGLGHMAVMIASAMGASVTAISTSAEKQTLARSLGAENILLSDDEETMAGYRRSFDFLLCTIPDSFDVNLYLPLLKAHGSLVTVGLLGPYQAPTNNAEVAQFGRTVGGSLIGGVGETQEVLDFCAKHQIQPLVEVIRMDEINDAFAKLKKNAVHFRYVVDMKSL